MNRNLVEWNTGGIRPLIFEKAGLEKSSENQFVKSNARSTVDGARNDSQLMGQSHAIFVNTKSQFQ